MRFDNEPDFADQDGDAEDAPPDDTGLDNQNEPVSLGDVEQTVRKEFDERIWRIVETVLSVHATHLIDGIEACFGLIIEGPSGCGKTTSLRPFEAVHGQFYRSDDITPASFVSHDSSRTEEELQEQDLLPKIRQQTVLNPEMANWFAGSWETRGQKMARLVRVMDGTGFKSDSGTHGGRGYQGNYRFNLIGATTPLDPKDWEMMGHTGNRFLFHEMSASDNPEADREAIFGGVEYGRKIKTTQSAVTEYLEDLWIEYDGPGSVDWNASRNRAIEDDLLYLAELVRHARAPLNDDEKPEQEDIKRIGSMLRDLARGHALLHERQHIERTDLEVCARVALSTMPWKRRRLVRELVQLEPGDFLKTSEVIEKLNVSRPTALNRMEIADALKIGIIHKKSVQGGDSKAVAVHPKFTWPDSLPYPSL